jgi:tetratricopeptide (TPR) repeat protein
MKLFLLKLRLAYSLAVFTLGFIANKSPIIKPLVVAVFIVILLISLFLLLPQEEQITKLDEKNVLQPSTTDLYKLHQLTDEQALKELEFLLKIYQKQPQSRDLLINISQLYLLIGNQLEAEYYLQEAIKIDPNHPSLQYE